MSDSRRLPSDDLLTLAAIKRDGSFDALKVQMLAVLKQDVRKKTLPMKQTQE
jgi:hypothetical protein